MVQYQDTKFCLLVKNKALNAVPNIVSVESLKMPIWVNLT